MEDGGDCEGPGGGVVPATGEVDGRGGRRSGANLRTPEAAVERNSEGRETV